ncbi:MAG: hypothetical protein ABW170_04635 [Candidatus Thiodiazotropha sp. L084R]
MGDNNGIIVTGTVKGDVKLTIAGTPLVELHQPWLIKPDPDNTAALLTWKSRIPKTLYGRDVEMAELLRWAEDDYPLKVRLIYGEGGVGKTRLAFELAARLSKQSGWLAGQVKAPDDLVAYPLGDEGTLLIIDYPEEQEKAVKAFMQRLARVDEQQVCKLRILLLARRVEANALVEDLIDRCDEPIILSSLTLNQDEQAWHIFCDSWVGFQACKNKQDSATMPLEQHVFLDWLASYSLHRRPLFIVAFALNLIDNPEQIGIGGSAIIRTLVDREIRQLRKEIEELNRNRSEVGETHLQFEAILLLKALAGITGKLDRSAIEALQAIELDDIQLPSFRSIIRTSAWREGGLPAIEPDLFAAQLLDSVLNMEEMSPGPWLYNCLKLQNDDALCKSLVRLGRLQYDYHYELMEGEGSEVHGAYTLIDKLSETVKQDHAFCNKLEHCLARGYLERPLLPIAIVVYQTLVKVTKDVATRAIFENNLSVHLQDDGDIDGAFAASQRAVTDYETLAEEDCDRFGAELASSLSNLSIRLIFIDDRVNALKAIRRSLAISKKLTKNNLNTDDLVMSEHLNNLSKIQAANGYQAKAYNSIIRAVKIQERLAKNNDAAYVQDALAGTLINLALRLKDRRDYEGALDATRRSVKIRKPLSKQNFLSYGPHLADSLEHLSRYMAIGGDQTSALHEIRMVLEIREKFARMNFNAYGHSLLLSLMNQITWLCEINDYTGALNAIRWAEENIGSFINPGLEYVEWKWMMMMKSQLTSVR